MVKLLLKSQKTELEKELKILKEKKRPEVLKQLKYARSLGDLSENAEYHAAREAQAILEDRILEIESVLKSSKVIKVVKNADVVSIGSVVTVVKKNETMEYTIIGSVGADISKNYISSDSPIGEALLGGKVGDKVVFETPGGKTELKIKSIK